MFTRYRTKGIFIKKIKKFEADEYLIAYTEDFGKIGLTGKSIRKIKSKLSSGSRLFCFSNIEFVRGRHYNILTDVELISSFPEIRNDLSKLSVAFRMTSLIGSFLTEEEKDDILWQFIERSFFLLEDYSFGSNPSLKKKRIRRFYYYFAFKFLEILGYKPEVGECVVDKKRKTTAFSPREGGLVCRLCAQKIKDPLQVKMKEEDRIFLKAISEKKFENFLKEELEFSEMGQVLKNYITLLPSGMS